MTASTAHASLVPALAADLHGLVGKLKRRLREQELDYQNAVATLTRAAELVEAGEFDPAVLATVAARAALAI